jgi:hypothetical protein
LFYSVGAVLNLAKWPVLSPGVFAAHELFHFFVIAGSACHIFFMLDVVVPAPGHSPLPAPSKSRPLGLLLLRWTRAVVRRRLRQWMVHIPHPRWLENVLAAGDPLDPVPVDGPVEVV